MLYQKIIRPILFLMPAETAHDFTLFCLKIFNRFNFLNNLLFKFFNFTSPKTKQKLFGHYFRTPIGLSAGMDKNATAVNVWPSFNFGFLEIGSITSQAQSGNPKPRLWRLPQDKALVVYFGLANMGAKKINQRLQNIKTRKRGVRIISIAKNNQTSLEQAANDYIEAFKIIAPQADIISINLSCPNVSNFTGLQQKELLEPILAAVTKLNTGNKPLWLKIGQDLSKNELDDVITLVKQYNIAAIIATNLSKDKSKLNLTSKNQDKPGGVSGQPISQKVNKIIAYLYKNSENKYKIVACGGVFSGLDAFTKIKAGADLITLATGFIYGGPFTVKKINQDLVKLLKENNYSHLSQAIGKEAQNYEIF